MFSLQAFLPLFLPCSPLALFSGQFSPALYYLNAWTPGNRLPSVAKGTQGRGSISLLRSRSGRRGELA